ncbi:MAG: hypothetical protein ABSF70_13005 [Terracidiphilus sp.]|jgi:hypothetical protein
MKATAQIDTQLLLKFEEEPVANLLSPAEQLEAKVRVRLRQPIDATTDAWIKRAAELAVALGRWNADMREALEAIKPPFKKERVWGKTLKDIATDAGVDVRTLKRLLKARKADLVRGKKRDEARCDQAGSGASCSPAAGALDPVSDAVMASAEGKVGRLIRSDPETDKEFTCRSLRAALARFPAGSQRSRQGAMRYLLTLTKGLGIPLSVLAAAAQ